MTHVWTCGTCGATGHADDNPAAHVAGAGHAVTHDCESRISVAVDRD